MVLHPSHRVLSTNHIGCGTSMTLPKASYVVANTFLDTV